MLSRLEYEQKFRTPRAGEVTTVIADPPAHYRADNNIFKMVNQLEITGYEKRIPDGILYINGLPLVVFEFKSAIREEATKLYENIKKHRRPEGDGKGGHLSRRRQHNVHHPSPQHRPQSCKAGRSILHHFSEIRSLLRW
jgi:type I site-specific restriction-modification system R (restriction) subunit